jgi:hypothetical protein
MAERRSQVMIVVDAWWEGPDGSLQKGRARIVNKSVSGACVRTEKQIQVGAKLRIESRWDDFCGIVKYCRRDGRGYLVGIQREAGAGSIPKQTAKSLLNGDERRRQETTFQEPRVPDGADRQRYEPIASERRMPATVPNWDEPLRDQNLAGDPLGSVPLAGAPLAGEQKAESTRIAEIGASAAPNEAIAEVVPEVLVPRVGHSKSSRRRWQSSQSQGVRPPQWWEALATVLLNENKAQKERGSRAMEINWMGRGKRDAEDAKENGQANSGGAGEKNKPTGAGSGDTGDRNKAAAAVVAPQPMPLKVRGGGAVDGDLTYQSELLPLEEIYAAAGIVSPRRGYTIKKVMEMLHSEHLSALSKEMRRASVMMALDAAGISVEEVLRDAQLRLDTIKSYEEDQKQLCEAEWARKAEEHGQLKAELEQVRARFMERMKQTLEGIARDRARFGAWLTTMHEEAQTIAETVELCTKPAPPVLDSVAPKAEEAKEAPLKVV